MIIISSASYKQKILLQNQDQHEQTKQLKIKLNHKLLFLHSPSVIGYSHFEASWTFIPQEFKGQ